MDELLRWMDFLAIAVLAVSGALVASRKQMDIVGFILIAAVTGFGGGTVRDLLLGRTPVFWLQSPAQIGLCAGLSVFVFFFAQRIESRFRSLLWADAIGLALYAIVGTETALSFGVGPAAAVLLGTVTATFGGILRDIICNEVPLILRKEIYATAAAAGAALFVLLTESGLAREYAFLISAGFVFAIRAIAILRGWSLPTYRRRTTNAFSDDV
jgi:uncharacterized membrane protein YeiH